ncbi:glycosyltransferase [Actinomycetospora endophytica]|uniref:Glycosyltransferase n=1 Tax=Actinomycetospora endophytica TaxID=2291215 RepID=A0ABS8PCZ3_9PSEU|nr:glycosyltransferase [Actinomycetospora endophytica]MCD2196150.1 glycosyltransferase [Actinomycetospora endophytica]
MTVTVRRARRRGIMIAAVTLIGFGVWAAHHAVAASYTFTGRGTQFGLLFLVAFVMLGVQTVLYYLESPYTTTPEQDRELDALRVVIPVPVYNEDPGLLRECLWSMLGQRRLPGLVYVVDDGSKLDYSALRDEYVVAAAAVGVEVRWVRTANGGKRHAQGLVFADTPDADVYVTVDSDAILVPDAIEEVLKPLADPRVQSVAGIVLAANARKNLLTRVTDLWFVTGQLVDRSAASTTGSVLVNSGPLAAYRGGMVRDHLESYLNETFFGRGVEFSDDSMLTIFALTRGKAVQQPTAFALTAMPENLSHHLRQYLRWMRGAFIRSWWRFKYLPLSSVAFWNHLVAWAQMLIATMLFLLLFIIGPAAAGGISPLLFVVPVIVGFAQSLRYLTIRRSDESVWSQLATLALSPVATLWAFTVLRVVRWYGMATCLKTGWGTREEIEVTSFGGAPVELAPAESLCEVLDLKALVAAHKAVVSGTGPRHTPAAVAARLNWWGPASEVELAGRHRA